MRPRQHYPRNRTFTVRGLRERLSRDLRRPWRGTVHTHFFYRRGLQLAVWARTHRPRSSLPPCLPCGHSRKSIARREDTTRRFRSCVSPCRGDTGRSPRSSISARRVGTVSARPSPARDVRATRTLTPRASSSAAARRATKRNEGFGFLGSALETFAQKATTVSPCRQFKRARRTTTFNTRPPPLHNLH